MPPPRRRSIGAIDVGASALARIAPKRWRPAVDQLRCDLRALADGLTGKREPTYRDPGAPSVTPVPLSAIDPIEHALPRRLRLRYVTMRDDAKWIARDLRGHARPYLIDRGQSRYRASQRPMLAMRPLIVERVIHETPDAVSVVLREPGGSPLAFEAGQFLTFELEVDGQPLRRAYSLSTSPLDGPSAAITVKRAGRASAWLCDHLRAGATLMARGPSGNFLAPNESDPACLVMIAGGSGITPVISILETILRSRPELSAHLIYGNKSERDAIFIDRLSALAAAHEDRFTLEHVLSDPSDAWTGTRGILERDTLARCLDVVSEGSRRIYYLCGPAAMMDGARELLSSRGVPTDRIVEERFHSPLDASAVRAELPDVPVIAQMSVRGRRHRVSVAPGQTLLDAGLAAGVELPFSCAMGGCGACKVVLVSGEVHMEESCLSDRERRDGYVLACSSRPKGPVSIEVAR